MKKIFYSFMFLLSFINLTFAQPGWVQVTNPLGSGDAAMLGKIQFVSPTEGWISGSRGSLLHTTNGGNAWTIVTPFPSDTVFSSSDPAWWGMSWVNQNYGWKMNTIGVEDSARGAVIYKTTNGGTTWEKKILSTNPGDNGIQVQFVNQNTGWVLVYNFSTFAASFLKTTDGGNNWTPFNGHGLFFFVNENYGWSYTASGPSGTNPPYIIYSTTNGGLTWLEQFRDSTNGALNAIYFVDQNNGWLVGYLGKVLKTSNGGATWNFVTNTGVNPNQRGTSVFFLNPQYGWIPSKDDAGNPFVQHTTDGGLTWQTQPTPIGSPFGNNAIFYVYFTDTQNGWFTADLGKLCRYSGVSGVGDNENLISSFKLHQNYPNPFNPSTRIQYQVSSNSYVTVKAYDMLGKEIATLVDGYRSAGNHEIEFDAYQLSSGIYFYQLRTSEFLETRKMILTK